MVLCVCCEVLLMRWTELITLKLSCLLSGELPVAKECYVLCDRHVKQLLMINAHAINLYNTSNLSRVRGVILARGNSTHKYPGSVLHMPTFHLQIHYLLK